MYICFLLLGRAQQILIIISEREMKRIEWMMAALYVECNLYLLAPLSSTILFIAYQYNSLAHKIKSLFKSLKLKIGINV